MHSGAEGQRGNAAPLCGAAAGKGLTMSGKTSWVSEGQSVAAELQFRTRFAGSGCPSRSCFGFLSVVSRLLPNLAFVP